MRSILFSLALMLPAAELPRYEAVTVTGAIKMGYQFVVADLNRDGKPDLIVVDERGTELAWYENPSWQRHVIAADVPRTINVDAYDYDGDGIPEIAIGYHFETDPAKSVGNLAILKSGPDPRQPWSMREIDRVPTIHRLRWIDRKGDGRKVLLAAPMIGLKARPPEYADNVPVYLYQPGEWKRTVYTELPRGILHSINPVHWQGRGEQLMTADFLGIRLLLPRGPRSISAGDPRPCPQCGSSETKAGRLGKRRFIAAIEPWHGNQVVVYTEDGKQWKRHVIEDGMINGHALAVGDLNGDGRDEIVAGFRGKGFQLYIFTADDPAGEHWSRHILDPGGMAAADCKIADFTGDGRPDIACVGASTGNLKLYTSRPGSAPAAALSRGVALYRRAVEQGEIAGAVLLVARHGKIVLHEAVGWRDCERRLPMEKTTLFRMASNTKPLIAAGVLMLAEEKKLRLDEPVSKYLRSFDNDRARGIRIQHLLSHTSGMHIRDASGEGVIFFKPLLEKSAEHPDAPSLQAEVSRFGAIGAEKAPGSTYAYSDPGYNTLGALIEVVSGRPLGSFLQERIYGPLRMKETWSHESRAPQDRMAVVYKGGSDGRLAVVWKPGDGPAYPFVRASGGMIASAADYLRFCRFFLNGGELDGTRVLTRERVKAAITPAPNTKHPYRGGLSWYGLGWELFEGGVFGHHGSDGTFAWIDPRTDTIALVLTQTQRGTDTRVEFLRLVAEAARERQQAR